MSKYTSLDARSLAAPGGLGDRIAAMLASVGDSYATMADRRDQRRQIGAMESMRDERANRRERLNRVFDLATATGEVPDGIQAGMAPEDFSIAQALAARGKRQVAQGDEDRQLRQEDMRALIAERKARAGSAWAHNADQMGQAVRRFLPGFLGGTSTSHAGASAVRSGTDPIRIRTQKGTVLLDPRTRQRVGFVDDETGEVTWDGAGQVKVGQEVGGVPAQSNGEDGKVMFPTPSVGAGTWRDVVLNANANLNPVSLLTRMLGAHPELGANAGGQNPAPTTSEPSQAFKSGAGGWSTMFPAGLSAPARAPEPSPAAAPAGDPLPQAMRTIENERDALGRLGIDHRQLLSPNIEERRAVLARMPIDARRRAIDALRIIDSQPGR